MNELLNGVRTGCCGAAPLLGIVFSPTTVIILRSLQGIAAIVAVVALVNMWKILMSMNHHSYLNKTDKNESNGQDNQPASKTLQLCRRLRLILGNKGHKLGHQGKLLPFGSATVSQALHEPDDVPDSLSSGVIHKSKHATMPNDQAHAPATKKL